MILDWVFRFRITYIPDKGVKLTFPFDPVFEADVSFSFEKCIVRGYFGFLGAEITANGAINGSVAYQLATTPHGQANIATLFYGHADVGLAGKLIDKIICPKTCPMTDLSATCCDTVNMLPHFDMNIELVFDWKLRAPLLMPVVKISNGSFCLGQIIANAAGHVAQQAMKILEPFKKILGPAGILLMDVPATQFVFGKVRKG